MSLEIRPAVAGEEDVVFDLQSLIREKQAGIQTGPLPTLRAYPLEVAELALKLRTGTRVRLAAAGDLDAPRVVDYCLVKN